MFIGYTVFISHVVHNGVADTRLSLTRHGAVTVVHLSVSV